MILGATALTKADTSSAGKIRKKVTCSTMASWAHPGNWICGRAGTGPSIDRSRPHHTDAAARPPAARGWGARGLRRGGAVGRRAQRSDVVDASRSLQSIGVLPTRGLCRRRSWTPRQTGLQAGEGRHNPRCRTRGVQNRTEASRVDVRSNAWLAQRRTLLRGQRFHFNRGAEDRVAAKQSCARGIAPRRTSAARQVAQDCADRASRNLLLSNGCRVKVGTIGDRDAMPGARVPRTSARHRE
jgi:hypothetical protein